MSETTISESNSIDSQVPAEDVVFPPLPEPRDVDFDEDISEDEKTYYKNKFQDLNTVAKYRLHCTACDRHLGCSASHDSRMRAHPMLRTLVCNTCFAFYNSGEFEKGDDGSELYCRWCGQGGQVYCCSECPHVFCAKCIKRNLGLPKIREIENTDDWKCFKCNNKSLWDLRAACWALMRYCDLKNRITMATQDKNLKDKYQELCARDYSECCKHKKRRDKIESKKREDKKESENSAKKAAAVISKIPPTIQVKKFASINVDDVKPEKKAIKRSTSPKNKPIYLKNPITVASGPKTYSSSNLGPMPKKIRMSSTPIVNPNKFVDFNRKSMPNIRIRPKPPHIPQLPIPIINQFNGFNNTTPFNNTTSFVNNFVNDNINLSLESLTQGLDMSAVTGMNNNGGDDDVICTPDFPMEPLCEVTEDNTDDDVQCITPAPRPISKLTNPPPLVPRSANILPDLNTDNIIQMTENDVTVNAQTGGLKFRVDPQTLSSNKMYRLPDGRIFAINANSNMPGGYSATIVAVTETCNKLAPKGATYAAKLSAVTPQILNSGPVPKLVRAAGRPATNVKRSTPNTGKVTRGTETITRDWDLEVPVEWYRYNLIDAIDALEYSVSRLNKLKKDATTVHLRTRSVSEMRTLHRTLDRLLHTSTTRFNEIRDNLNKGLKQYLLKKSNGGNGANNISEDDEDDDDVEILPNPEENEDPIFIDENSVDSNANDTHSIDQQEVDLTGAMSSSELNDSGDKSLDIDENFLKANEEMEESSENNDTISKTAVDPLSLVETDEINETINVSTEEKPTSLSTSNDDSNSELSKSNNESSEEKKESDTNEKELLDSAHKEDMNGKDDIIETLKDDTIEKEHVVNTSSETSENVNEVCKDKDVNINDSQDSDGKIQDAEMSEEMIETLLKGDDGVDDDDNSQSVNMDIADGDDENAKEKSSLNVEKNHDNKTEALKESISVTEGV